MDSARTGSTLSDEEPVDEFDVLMAKISQDANDLEMDDMFHSCEKFPNAGQHSSNRNSHQSIPSTPTKGAKSKRSPREVDAGLTVNLAAQPAFNETTGLLSPKVSNVTANSSMNSGMVNNLSAQAAKGPTPRTSLSTMENSVQNFKTKSPVNQMQETAVKRIQETKRPTSKIQRSYNAEIAMEDDRKRKIMAASKIQHWFRSV